MKCRSLLLNLLLLILPAFAFGQVVLEDFEGATPKLPWNAVEGSFSVVANPAGGDTLGINPGGKVGSYKKQADRAYSLFLAELAQPLDLSVNNRFRVMVKAPKACNFILKLEGGGKAIEATRRIAVPNQWVEYYFNFAGAASFTTMNKILLFFDAGTEGTSDTFLFDNLVAESCAGAAAIDGFLDDFECQRSVSYGDPGYLDVKTVDNPDKSGINTSAKVGRYRDTLGEWHALVLPFTGDIPLEGRSLVKIKVWAPKAGTLKFKLEGTGGAKEVDAQVTQLNKWVEYTADFTSEIGKKYQKLVFFFNAGVPAGTNDIYYFDDLRMDPRPNSVVLEDFEGGAKLNWNPIEGAYSVIDNPAGGNKLGINAGGKVGSYTKKQGSAYSLFLAELPAPLPMSIYNQFRIMVKAPRKTSFILKLENADNSKSIERTKVIAVDNEWIEYTFNFSAAKDIADLKKILLFFDPGVDTSGGTYLFDNLVMELSGACEGVAMDPVVFDDFECQRNIPIANPGFDDVAVVANPDITAANESAKVGRYYDRPGPWHALVYDYRNDIPLADRNVVKIKVWAPTTGILKIKLEGTSAPTEIDAPVTVTKKWVQYSADFTKAIGNRYQKLVFFFKAGEEPGVDTVYYIDDIRLEPQGMVTLEDFEPTPKQTWEALGAEAVFGKFNGGIDNPDKSGVNTTNKVGSYTKGSSKLGGLKALLPDKFSLANFPQLNLQVWAPEGAKSLTVKLKSVEQGTKEINRPIAETKKWVDLSFNFDNFKTINDFEEIEIVFDPDLASTANWYFDNLTQTKPTVDPCEGVVANPKIIDNFDCQRNYANFFPTDANAIEIVRNPDPSGINPAANNKVAKYTDPAGAGKEWSAIVWDFGKEVDLSAFNVLTLKLWSPKAVPLLFKVEGGTQYETASAVKAADVNKWVEYQISFKPAAGKKNTKFVLFINQGNVAAAGDVYYIDDVEWRREPYTACITDFETSDANLGKWQYFAAVALEGKQVDIVVDNPKKSALNPSNKVAEFIEEPGGQPWTGMFNASLPAQIFMGTNKSLTMKVWMDHAADVVLKLERSPNGAPNIGDAIAKYTTPNEWQTLTWNYPALNPAWNMQDGAIYTTLAIVMDLTNVPTTEKRYYFDDLAIGTSSCGSVTGVRDLNLEALTIYPNPASSELTIENSGNLIRYEVFNAVGQRVHTIVTNGQYNLTIDLSNLDRGMYLLAGYDRQGVLRANARFIKQ